MQTFDTTDFSAQKRRSLLTLCRFLALRTTYYTLLIMLTATGILLTALSLSQFAPYGIALLCLLLPSFLHDSLEKRAKKENSDSPLSFLYKRYHYSPVSYASYRISVTVGMLLLLPWHRLQNVPFTVFGISIPLLYLFLCLTLPLILSRILFLRFHHRLMNGTS